jgi:hypothetical protein
MLGKEARAKSRVEGTLDAVRSLFALRNAWRDCFRFKDSATI